MTDGPDFYKQRQKELQQEEEVKRDRYKHGILDVCMELRETYEVPDFIADESQLEDIERKNNWLVTRLSVGWVVMAHKLTYTVEDATKQADQREYDTSVRTFARAVLNKFHSTETWERILAKKGIVK